MSADLIIAVPSKGRLQEMAQSFFDRAGLRFKRPGGARNYRGRIAGLDGVEIAFLSASEIARELGAGHAHLGVTGLDLLQESLPDFQSAVHLITPLGFGHADVVVALPKAWIDARGIPDLADIATDFRARHGRPLRVATKYVHLTQGFFADHGIADYRIVESLGATEGAPAAGTAELIVDITTTGSTLEANHLKIPEGGIILKSQAHLTASLKAQWSTQQIAVLRTILDRIQAEERARLSREIRAVSDDAQALGAAAVTQWGCSLPFPIAGNRLELHCPADRVQDCVAWLKAQGVETLTVSRLDYVFSGSNPFFDAARDRIQPG